MILEADTVIEEQATDKEGKLTFTADLPIGFAYYIKETSPAPGFATTDETQEFTFEYEGAEKWKNVSYAFTFEGRADCNRDHQDFPDRRKMNWKELSYR